MDIQIDRQTDRHSAVATTNFATNWKEFGEFKSSKTSKSKKHNNSHLCRSRG